MKKLLTTLAAFIATLALCITVAACKTPANYSVAGKTYEYFSCDFSFAETAPDYMKNTREILISSLNNYMKNSSISFDDQFNCIYTGVGNTAEYNYRQEGNKIIVAGGGGTDGMVLELSEDESTLVQSSKTVKGLEQIMKNSYIESISIIYLMKK